MEVKKSLGAALTSSMASRRLDLPEPLEPTRMFNDFREIASAESPKLKKLFNLMDFINMTSLVGDMIVFFDSRQKIFASRQTMRLKFILVGANYNIAIYNGIARDNIQSSFDNGLLYSTDSNNVPYMLLDKSFQADVTIDFEP